MGETVLAAQPAIERIQFALPNRHHVLYDLARFGLDSSNEIFHARTEPYGLIEGTVELNAPTPMHAANFRRTRRVTPADNQLTPRQGKQHVQ
jgi:hypothetical protein